MKTITNNIKLLGSLFYQKQPIEKTIKIVDALVAEDVLNTRTLDQLKSLSAEQFDHYFGVLFEGVGSMPVPPWGSVYLDKEKVLFGESNVQYRLFLQQNGVVLNSGQREPEDQFGLMLLACAYFIEQDNSQAACELLGEHLMPWGSVYLEQLQQKAPNSFYQHLGNDVLLWLQQLIKQLGIQVTKKNIYLK
ncbi:molecular chaperone [Vibrio sp. Hep-1b-8]|uniref:TorD/DmsD family molecular chaperone n=1 Tax=Vibrio sp. Hep-1b-8 TaxID=2144187 RepID=UPI001110AC1D|nr:molecular chaperone [Vibrio sp. Hep-1b-8]TMX45681.1 dimethylsulfoxide reductase [Vibrio sp. Hep-1b-8]